ncbi:hypothetical protein I4U23_004524 [Adineta vaga]|nr:hypothetical protein I4U23_004524 [Adineta vaga]
MAFIGESGSGKSTCINYFANYFTNSSFSEQHLYSNMKIVIPNSICPTANYPPGSYRHTERDIHNTSESQTQACTVYDFIWNGQLIKVIDTPGFNDTNQSKDDENIQKILKQFAAVPFITAIIITINGTTTRLSTSIKTTLSQLRGSLPDSVFKNLFFILSNCTEETKNFNLKLIAEFNPTTERTFYMQNALFCIKDRSILQNGKLVRRMVRAWEESVDTMETMMNEINRTSSTSVQAFEDMRIRRERLLAHKAMLIVKQKSLLGIMKALAIEEDRLKNANKNKQSNRNYEEDEVITIFEIETKPYYSTLCIQHGDVQICHENCSLSYEPSLNLAHFEHCAAADGKNCRHCKCGMNQHLHSYEIPVPVQTTAKKEILHKKTAFEQACKDVQQIGSQVSQLEYTKRSYQNEVNTIKASLLATIRELKKICTHFNFPEEMNSTIQNLRKEAKIAQDLLAKQEYNNTADAIEQLLRQL